MHVLMIAVTAALALGAATHTASAGDELNKAVSAGAYIHPTGPVDGIWHQDRK